jgi:hypothetical protein
MAKKNARRRNPSKVCRCGVPSLPGLISGVALCQYHYNERQWGKAWADRCRDKLDEQAGTTTRAAEPGIP